MELVEMIRSTKPTCRNTLLHMITACEASIRATLLLRPATGTLFRRAL